MDEATREEINLQLNRVFTAIELFVPDWFGAIAEGEIESSASGLAVFADISEQISGIVELLIKAHGLDPEEVISDSEKAFRDRTEKLVNFFESQTEAAAKAEWN
jgi:hypothetical protein